MKQRSCSICETPIDFRYYKAVNKLVHDGPYYNVHPEDLEKTWNDAGIIPCRSCDSILREIRKAGDTGAVLTRHSIKDTHYRNLFRLGFASEADLRRVIDILSNLEHDADDRLVADEYHVVWKGLKRYHAKIRTNPFSVSWIGKEASGVTFKIDEEGALLTHFIGNKRIGWPMLIKALMPICYKYYVNCDRAIGRGLLKTIIVKDKVAIRHDIDIALECLASSDANHVATMEHGMSRS